MDEIAKDVETVRQIEVIKTILNTLCDSTGMGFSAVARVTDDRWVACEVQDRIAFGLGPGGELDLKTTICADVRSLRQEVVIDHVDEDPVFCNHHTPAQYGFQSYVSVPVILPDGEMFGTLCAIDPKPRQLKGTPALAMFRLFAQLVAFHIDAARKLADSETRREGTQAALAVSEAKLARSDRDLASTRSELADSETHLNESREALTVAETDAGLREQFIAVLGHDLRNPLASMAAGIRLLSKQELDARTTQVLRQMNESALRMGGLIDNLMDFARGRLGGGIGIDLVFGQPIGPTLSQVAAEIRAAHPDREIELRVDLAGSIDADHARIAQMFSNLLGNAVTHGDVALPILVEAKSDARQFELSVANGGAPIPDAAMRRLFQPFYRAEVRSSLQGLGLGLFIASEIAKAHGGTLEVRSDTDETRFTFRMPARD